MSNDRINEQLLLLIEGSILQIDGMINEIKKFTKAAPTVDRMKSVIGICSLIQRYYSELERLFSHILHTAGLSTPSTKQNHHEILSAVFRVQDTLSLPTSTEQSLLELSDFCFSIKHATESQISRKQLQISLTNLIKDWNDVKHSVVINLRKHNL